MTQKSGTTETTGFLMINRRFFNHAFWKEERTFSKCEAWLDMIQLARFEQSEANELIKGKLIKWNRGEFPGSVRFLAERWNWGRTKVAEFMKLLEEELMITRRTDQGETIISLCNYEDYNTPSGQQNGQKGGQVKNKGKRPQQSISDELEESEADSETDEKEDTGRTVGGQWADKTNKENKEKKINYRSNVKLTKSENDRLVEEFGQQFADACYDYYSNWKKEKGKTSKDDNLTIRRWVIDAVSQKKLAPIIPLHQLMPAAGQSTGHKNKNSYI